jgi:hypothetical protein
MPFRSSGWARTIGGRARGGEGTVTAQRVGGMGGRAPQAVPHSAETGNQRWRRERRACCLRLGADPAATCVARETCQRPDLSHRPAPPLRQRAIKGRHVGVRRLNSEREEVCRVDHAVYAPCHSTWCSPHAWGEPTVLAQLLKSHGLDEGIDGARFEGQSGAERYVAGTRRPPLPPLNPPSRDGETPDRFPGAARRRGRQVAAMAT